MSVLFATITPDSVILCADKLATHSKTGEKQVAPVNKIEQWSPTVAIGGTGIKTLCEIITSGVRGFIEENGLDQFTLEEIADLFGQCYYSSRELYPDMPKEARAEFVIAGKLSDGHIGAIQVIVGNDEADIETIVSNGMPTTLIFAPADMSHAECNELFQKAIRNTLNKNTHQRDLLEAAHRKAVRYVSERSKFVGPKTDYIVLKPNGPQ